MFCYSVSTHEMVDSYYGNLNELYQDLAEDSEFAQALRAVDEKWNEFANKTEWRRASCFNCPDRCRHSFHFPGGLSSLELRT